MQSCFQHRPELLTHLLPLTPSRFQLILECLHRTPGSQLAHLPISSDLSLLKELASAQHVVCQGVHAGLNGTAAGLHGRKISVVLPALTNKTNLPSRLLLF